MHSVGIASQTKISKLIHSTLFKKITMNSRNNWDSQLWNDKIILFYLVMGKVALLKDPSQLTDLIGS